jgi:RES domain-containing protein
VTVTVYRLAKARYRDHVFSGIGGLHAHGRWTSRGRPVVYTSESIALAVLEYTVHYRRRGWVPASVLGRAIMPGDACIEAVTVQELPRDWSQPDPPSMLREIGQDWLDRGAAAALKVPSAVVTEEWNYLLNPRHPDFGRLSIGEAQPYEFHRRLGRTRRS